MCNYFCAFRSAELESRHHVDLLVADGLRLDWHIDDRAASVRFTLTNPFAVGRPYFTLGFTKWGELRRSDRVQFHRSLGRLVVEVSVYIYPIRISSSVTRIRVRIRTNMWTKTV